jgi:hypothetical protein
MLDRLLSISFPVEVFSLERTFSFGYDSCCVNVMTMKIYMDTSHPEGLHSAIYTVLSLESLSRSSEKRVLLSHTLAMPQIINAKLRNPAVSMPPNPQYTDCQDELPLHIIFENSQAHRSGTLLNLPCPYTTQPSASNFDFCAPQIQHFSPNTHVPVTDP